MIELKIDNEFRDLIPPLTNEEYNQLKENILQFGVLDSVKTWNGYIIDGHNRFKIVQENNIIKYPIEDMTDKFVKRIDVIGWILNNQTGRRNLSPYDKCLLALKYKNYLEIKGKENMSIGGKNGKQNEGLPILVNPTNDKINSQEMAAEKYNISKGTLNKVQQIEEKATPDIKDQLKNGTMSIDKAYMKTKQTEKKDQLQSKPMKPLTGEFDVIYIDPPWQYNFEVSETRAIENQYPTMTQEDLFLLSMPHAKDSVCYMWTTAPKLQEGIELLIKWGFTYKTCAIWDKQIKGMGYWFRINHEILLVGTTGKFSPPATENRYDSIYSEKRGKHSKKPDFYYDLIEKMYPNMRYLEVFARQRYNDKWEVWGFESM